MKLGKMEEVDIRSLWKHEQYDFSNWLAKEENEFLEEASAFFAASHRKSARTKE